MITKEFFGNTKKGEEVYKYILDNGVLKLSVLTYGATVQGLVVPSKIGVKDVVLGYNTVGEYEDNDGYLGATVGRCANRIAEGKFYLNGRNYTLDINDKGCQNLHGGNDGFSYKVFTVKSYDENSSTLTMEYFSPNGESNFPGNMFVYVTFSLDEGNFNIEYLAKTDKDTLCNMTNHAYFNLNGENEEGAFDSFLTIDADYYHPTNKVLIPTGEFKPIENTPFDFREAKRISKDVNADDEDIKIELGYDANYVLNGNGFRKVATLYSEKTGIVMETYTDQIGVQFYSGAWLTERKGKNGTYHPNNSICLETQKFANAINTPSFPSVVLGANTKYTAKTTYKFLVKED